MGRASEYTQEIADKICEAIATSNKGLKDICASDPELPEPKTVYQWLARNQDFGERYAVAKQQQMFLMEDDLLSIADDTSNDTIVSGEGREMANSEWIARSRLRVDTRKWLMSKLAPKKYGDKQAVELSGEVATTHLTRAEWKKRIEEARA